MDKELLDQFMVEIKALLEKPTEGKSVASQDLINRFNTIMMEKSEEWSKEKREAVTKAAEAEAEKLKAENASKELLSKLAEQEEKFSDLKKQLDASAAQALFNGRMEQLGSLFTIDEDLRKIFTEDVKNLASEESAFTAYLDKSKVMLKGREKSEADEKALSVANALFSAEKDKDGKISKEDVLKALASADIQVAEITNSQSGEPSFADRFKNAGIVELKK